MPRGFYIRTEATREKNRQAALGREVSLETRRKLSEANKGKKSYVRTPEMREASRLRKLGHTVSQETRAKLSLAARPLAQKLARDPNWLEKVSQTTTKAMHDPSVRKRHLEGLKRSHKVKREHPFIERNSFYDTLSSMLLPVGFIKEHPVSKGLGHGACTYSIDFAHIDGKIAIECDGPHHRLKKQKIVDAKKDQVLRGFGWKVIRVPHD